MAFRFPVAGSISYGTFPVDTTALILSGFNTHLTAAGMTDTAIGSQAVGTFSGAGGNNGTITIGTQVYTLKTVINNANAREILIGATATDTANNLAAAINGGAGSGTLYSSATTAHPNVTASAASGVLTVTSTATGGGNFFALSIASSPQFTWQASATQSWGGGYKYEMPATPDGRSMVVYMQESNLASPVADVRFRIESIDGSFVSNTVAQLTGVTETGGMCVRAVAGRTLSLAACAHQFWWWLENDVSTIGTNGIISCPYLPSHLQGINPADISAVTNASPIQITTSSPHGLTTGQTIFNSDFLGNTAANGSFTVTVTSSTVFTLDGSTGNGAWTSGTGVIAGPGKVARCFFAVSDSGSFGNGSGSQTFRTNGMFFTTNNPTGFAALVVNNYSLTANVPVSSVYSMRVTASNAGACTATLGNYYPLSEARIVWPYTSAAGTSVEICELWCAFIVADGGTAAVDEAKLGFESHDWKLYGKHTGLTGASLWFATA
jgi:hypothetical protein